MTTWRNSDCMVPTCDNWASLDIRILPICYEHGYEISKSYKMRLQHDLRMDAREREELRERTIERNAIREGNRQGGVVYYAQIGDYIKIGYSTRLRDRFRTLRADRLLAIEPGPPELERQRHREFTSERIDRRRENFRPSDRLREHIETIHTEHPLPVWATLPRTSEISIRQKGDAA